MLVANKVLSLYCMKPHRWISGLPTFQVKIFGHV